MKLAIIGNCAYQALVDDRARIAWLCWPRFDSSFVFGELLDAERGGEFSIVPADAPGKAALAATTEQSYLPNTNILRTEVRSGAGSFEVVDFAPRFRLYGRFYKPTMLIRRVRPLAGKPVIRVRVRPVYDYGAVMPAHHTGSNHLRWLLPNTQLRLTTNAPLSYLDGDRPFVLQDTVYLVLTWGEPLEAALPETCENFLARTRTYWETWVKHGSLPHEYQEEVIRSALVLKLHQFEDTGAITAAATTSLPEHPKSGRCWDYRYCWLRDTAFTIGALRRLGQFEEMERFVTYLTNIAASTPDRLQPVYGITGRRDLTERVLDHLAGYQGDGPVRAGNQAFEQEQHDVYGEMLLAIAPLFIDLRFRSAKAAQNTELVARLLRRIEDTLEAPDAGLWEKRHVPRVHTFTLLMHWAGARMAARIGARCGDATLATNASALADRARALIDGRCWRAELGFFADAFDSAHADGSLFMMVNLGYLRRDDERARSHVDALAERLSSGDHRLFRYRHDDGIGETKASFTVCGFWYAEALARLGRTDEARAAFEALVAHANHVGLLSEDLSPETGEQWGNFPQTYSHVGLINAAFAISPPDEPGL